MIWHKHKVVPPKKQEKMERRVIAYEYVEGGTLHPRQEYWPPIRLKSTTNQSKEKRPKNNSV